MAIKGVHAIRTGGVAVKRPFLTRQGGAVTSKLRILASHSFTPELPILCWLIEHEEGDFLVDAGMCEAAAQPGSLDESLGPFDAWLSHRICRFHVAPGEGLGPQLRQIRPNGATGLHAVFTHLHSDHVDGLADLSESTFAVNAAEWQHPYGAPKRLLAGLRPQCFDLRADPALPFGASFPLSRAGDLFAVPTPGHTPHHCSIILRRGGVTFFFAGDVVYNQEQSLRGELAGAHAQPKQAAATLDAIREFARREPCIFLPSHDPRSEARLNSLELLRP